MTVFLQLEEVLAIRDQVMEFTGGRKSILDFTLLHSAIERPKATFGGKDLYPTLFEKAAALIHSLIQNHPFNDGNKRTAFAVVARFLYLNGYNFIAQEREIIRFTLAIQHHKTHFEDIVHWLKKHAGKKSS